MKRYRRILAVLITFILLRSFALPVGANAAEPPGFTVIVTNPPDDLSLFLLPAGINRTEAIELYKEQKAWETYFSFFYHMPALTIDNFGGAAILVQSGDDSFECPLPADSFSRYNNLLTLDLDTESLEAGQSALRVTFLIGMRVALTLLIEGLVFYTFGYREKNSWLAFLAINLMTQAGLNTMITGPGIASYWIFSFIFGELLVITVEIAVFTLLLKEHKRSRTVLYVLAANIASLILGGALIAYLPV